MKTYIAACCAFVSLAACTSPDAEAPKYAWERTLPDSLTLRDPVQGRGLRVARGIIHLHSVYSHDACDYDPQPGGKDNAPCDQHLREGLCRTRQDFAMLTDHATLMASTPWDRLFLHKDEFGDEPQMDGGELVGSRMHCPEAPSFPGVLLATGGENSLMPISLRRHAGSTAEERNAAMTAYDAAGVARLHQAGALVLQAHGEGHPLEVMRVLGLDGMEVYNLHANIDPKIREQSLGLPGLGAVAGLAPWLQNRAPADGGPEPDLALLGFLDENRVQIGKFETLLSEGQRLVAVVGSDAHENAFKQQLADGERGDSYRRLMRWFSNHLLVPAGDLTPTRVREALAQGRNYGVFEVFGAPVGFDFYAAGAEGAAGVAELGDKMKGAATLHLVAPRIPLPTGIRPDDVPTLRLRILHIAAGAPAGVQVADKTLGPDEALGAAAARELRFPATAAGAYRAEVRIVPRHLLGLLGDNPARFLKEYPYIYTSPIYLGQ